MTTGYLLHLIPAADFRALAPDEPHRPESLTTEGFIHCTREPEVLVMIANQFYRLTAGEFLVLVIDPAKVTAPVKFEPPTPPPADPNDPLAPHLFPHIYGPLNRDAIVEVRTAQRAPDGTFLKV